MSQDDVQVAYALVTPCGQPFGDLLQFRVEKKVEMPVCVTLQAPDPCHSELKAYCKGTAEVSRACRVR